MSDKHRNNTLDELQPAGTMDRRCFITGSAALLALGLSPSLLNALPPEAREAMYYSVLEDGRVRCGLCPRGCIIKTGRRGACGVRENDGGKLYSLVYGKACAIHADPVEKKPFFHVLPGTRALSLATVGCNMTCKFCQNWQISQSGPEDVNVRYTSPEEIADKAKKVGTRSVAYTYGEPVVFYEYMLDIARAARKEKILNLVVTNGYYSREALGELCLSVDAIKVDLKAFDDHYYREICGARLKPVLDSLVEIRSHGTWLEIVYLMVPSLNDDPESIRAMARWMISELGPDVPVHFSRFQPQYRMMNIPPTPVEALEKAWKICLEEGIHYVYIGNLYGNRAENTFCHGCGKIIIARKGFTISSINMKDGCCAFCGERIPGIWT